LAAEIVSQPNMFRPEERGNSTLCFVESGVNPILLWVPLSLHCGGNYSPCAGAILLNLLLICLPSLLPFLASR